LSIPPRIKIRGILETVMKIVFFGTPDYVVPIVNLLHKSFSDKTGKSAILTVVTQKPKPYGRKQEKAYSPVDTWAYKKKIPVTYELAEIPFADLGVLAAYGEIIPDSVIRKFKFGILNIHPSLLPIYRGASPIQAAIASMDKETGVTIIKIDSHMDHGPIIAQFKETISQSDTLGSLRERLFARASEVLVSLIPPYLQSKIKLREQEHDGASYTSLVKKEHGYISPAYLQKTTTGKPISAKWIIPFIKDYSQKPSAQMLDAYIRALNPWPTAWSDVLLNPGGPSRRLKILSAHIDSGPENLLILDEVQLEGKNTVSFEEFKRGYPKASFV